MKGEFVTQVNTLVTVTFLARVRFRNLWLPSKCLHRCNVFESGRCGIPVGRSLGRFSVMVAVVNVSNIANIRKTDR